MLSFKSKISDINGMIINPEYSDIISMIMDGELKAAGSNYLIFLYKTSRMKEEFNLNLIKIDKLLSDLLDNDIKTIAVDIENWNIIKEEFNSKKKKYKMLDEPKNLEEYLKNISNDESNIDNLFGEIVEYN